MKGQFMVGATYSADRVAKEEVRKATIARGQFMTSTPAATRRAPLPKDLEQFEGVVEAAGPLHKYQVEIAELARRLALVRAELDQYKKPRGSK